MEIISPSGRSKSAGPAEWFTGTVTMAELDPPGAMLVTFAPRARTAWHTHPNGQTLLVVAGTARVGREGAPPEDVGAGTIVRFAPAERHWHGAAPGAEMSHVAVQRPGEDGRAADWEQHVDDAQYG